MGILKFIADQFKGQFNLNKIKNINVVKKDNIVYAAYYKDRGDGYSDVECIIRPIYNKQEYSFNANVKIPNELIKDDKPVIIPIESEGKDGIALIFPKEQTSGKKKHSVLSFSTYQVDIKSDSIEITPSGEKTYLSNNAELSHSSNKYHNYSKPRAMKLSNGDILVTAIDSNSEGQCATAWLLEKRKGLEFEINEGSNRGANRLLFKTDSDIESDFVLLSTKSGMQIIYSDSTSLFSLDITESMIDDIKDGKYMNNEDEECLFAVGKGEHCEQFDNRISSSFLTATEVSNLSAVNTKSGIVIAFLENQQQLCLAKLTGKKGEKPEKHVISTFTEPIKSLQLNVDKNNVIISAIGEKSIMRNVINPDNLSKVTTKNFQIDSVRNIGDFVNIIYDQLLELTTALPFTILPTISTEISTKATTVQESTTYISTSTKGTTAQPTETTTASTTITTKPTTIRTTQSTTTQPSTTTASTMPPTTETTVKSTQATTEPITVKTTQPSTTKTSSSNVPTTIEISTEATTEPTTVTTIQPSTTTSKTTTKRVQSTITPPDTTTSSTKETTSRGLDVTTTETSTATNAILGLTTLTSTIGSAMITTFGLATQNTTNMLTTDNNLMMTDNSSEFNQTDTSPNFEERSLNAAWISGIAVAGTIGIGLTLYACYRYCCYSNMRLPSDYTDDNGFLQRVGRFFSGAKRQNNLELDTISGQDNTFFTIDSKLNSRKHSANSEEEEYEINQNDQDMLNSQDDLLSKTKPNVSLEAISTTKAQSQIGADETIV